MRLDAHGSLSWTTTGTHCCSTSKWPPLRSRCNFVAVVVVSTLTRWDLSFTKVEYSGSYLQLGEENNSSQRM